MPNNSADVRGLKWETLDIGKTRAGNAANLGYYNIVIIIKSPDSSMNPSFVACVGEDVYPHERMDSLRIFFLDGTYNLL